MSPYRRRCGRIGLVASLMVAIGCAAAVACIVLFDLSFDSGVWVGHRELVLYRDRLDFRFAAQTPMPIFGLVAPRTEADAQKIAENWRDGIASDDMAHFRWLHLPEFDFSLWWGIAAILLAPCFWLFQRQSNRVGFPVEVAEGEKRTSSDMHPSPYTHASPPSHQSRSRS